MESIEMFGRDAQLHAALRRCAPQMTVSLDRDVRDLPHVRVAYRELGPWFVSWDGQTYRWRTGPVAGRWLPIDAEEAAVKIARRMGAAVKSSQPQDCSCEAMNALPDRWWVSLPVLSDAFQVEMVRGDGERGLWWGNQVVGRALRREHGRWAVVGRDDVPLPNGAGTGGRYPTAEAALVRARDAWRQRAVTVSDDLGEDYWVEPRPVAGVDSLWLGRIHLGYVRQSRDGAWEAFTTNDERLTFDRGEDGFPTREQALLAVRGAWRTHLRRILRVTDRPR
ncbi:hypothetical protein BJF79_20985 [Actinomadura sp. CNU-125]|uniref:hypothetical protein n=1 Tax=Actinomadura sp. CNU-125 TaxID=1904961 RepID=UPI0009669F33|nr:hypothetical protein [Actinomadura sp. CNU-125]OLT13238.1 hypothetical protein BJF79_20985 [Actinomadura sp. CNU-125]